MWVHMHAHTQNRKLTQHTVHFQTPLTLAYDIVDDENKWDLQNKCSAQNNDSAREGLKPPQQWRNISRF